jgi:hypothetical protein
MFWQRISLHVVCVLRLSEAEYKDNGLLNLTEEMSRLWSVQAFAWIMLAAFSQVYNVIVNKKQSRLV